MKIRGLSIKYSDKKVPNQEKVVLSGLNLDIANDAVTVIRGESGCGKTTLFRIILGLEKGYEGTITEVPGSFSVVFQEDRLCEGLSAVENIKLVLKNADESLIRADLSRLGIEAGEQYKKVKAFSGGMRRRVAIVRAMMSESEMIIMDEPFTGLDDVNREKVSSYVKEKLNNRGLVLITHNEKDYKKFDKIKLVRLDNE